MNSKVWLPILASVFLLSACGKDDSSSSATATATDVGATANDVAWNQITWEDFRDLSGASSDASGPERSSTDRVESCVYRLVMKINLDGAFTSHINCGGTVDDTLTPDELNGLYAASAAISDEDAKSPEQCTDSATASPNVSLQLRLKSGSTSTIYHIEGTHECFRGNRDEVATLRTYIEGLRAKYAP